MNATDHAISDLLTDEFDVEHQVQVIILAAWDDFGEGVEQFAHMLDVHGYGTVERLRDIKGSRLV